MSSLELLALRDRVDAIDDEIVELLGRRFGVTDEIGQLKSRASLPPADLDREAAQFARYRELAARSGLDPDLVVLIFRSIIDDVVQKHRRA